MRYLFLRFLRIGLLAWGGPFAQLGLMHRELVERDGWVTEARFRKTLALYQALPGPEAHEMAVWFGHVKRGRLGGLMTGLGFMLPGVVLVTLLAALYVRYAGTMDAANVLLYGVKPVVIALLAFALVRLGRASFTTPTLAAIGVAAVLSGLFLPRLPFVVLLVLGGLVALAASRAGAGVHALAPLALSTAAFPALTLTGMGALALVALQAGLLSFGGAYTALPFLYDGAVSNGWMTDAQFLDALALSALVPGPLIAIGTFVGYHAAGLAGAALATVLIFTPAFGFTLLGHERFERLVHEPRMHAFLLGVTAAVVGFVPVATVPLARSALVDLPTVAIALGAFAALWIRKAPIPLVILAGAIVGALARLAG